MLGLLFAMPGVASAFSAGTAVIGFIGRCTVCMIALAIGAAWIAGDIHGHRKSNAACRSEQLAAELATKTADVDIARRAAADAALRAASIQNEADAANKRADDYAEELQKRPVPACNLNQSDLDRLRPSTRRRR